jgi:hypothetical protein
MLEEMSNKKGSLKHTTGIKTAFYVAVGVLLLIILGKQCPPFLPLQLSKRIAIDRLRAGDLWVRWHCHSLLVLRQLCMRLQRNDNRGVSQVLSGFGVSTYQSQSGAAPHIMSFKCVSNILTDQASMFHYTVVNEACVGHDTSSHKGNAALEEHGGAHSRFSRLAEYRNTNPVKTLNPISADRLQNCNAIVNGIFILPKQSLEPSWR